MQETQVWSRMIPHAAEQLSSCTTAEPMLQSPETATVEALRHSYWAPPVAQTVKNLPEMQEIRVWSLGLEDPLEKEIATHSSILAWEIPWTEEPGGPQSMGSQRVRHNWATSIWIYGDSTEAHIHTFHAPQQEKPPRWEAYATKLGSSPHLLQLEKKKMCSNKDPAQPNISNEKMCKQWKIRPIANESALNITGLGSNLRTAAYY